MLGRDTTLFLQKLLCICCNHPLKLQETSSQTELEQNQQPLTCYNYLVLSGSTVQGCHHCRAA